MAAIRVLIADDLEPMRKILAHALRRTGLEIARIVHASNGAEALLTLRHEPIDLLLCDLGMPVMDGLTLLRQMETEDLPKRPGIVVISGLPTKQRVEEAIRHGACGFLMKPYDAQQFEEEISRALRVTAALERAA